MLKLTSVKLLDNLYKKFKISNLDDSFTLQKLVNRSMDLYVHNERFTSFCNVKLSSKLLILNFLYRLSNNFTDVNFNITFLRIYVYKYND
jgi:hypothetical protein